MSITLFAHSIYRYKSGSAGRDEGHYDEGRCRRDANEDDAQC